MNSYIILMFLLSVLINILVIKATTKYNFFMDPLSTHKIQSIHKNHTPRAGGISVYLLSLIMTYFISDTMFFATLAFLPTFLYGIYEDIKGNTPQKVRLIVMAISCLIAVMYTGLTVQSIGFFQIPEYVQIPFTIFAIIGLASAINFIDGLNGLASGVTIITLMFLGFAAYSINNHELSATMFLISSIMFGFFILNFPFGKIFLGDAGAYYIGFILAVSSEALVFQNTLISPWFPAALLGYPIIETLFTMWRRYRRLKNKGIKFFVSERVHLHSLLCLRVFKSNSIASGLILLGFLQISILAFTFRSSNIICSMILVAETALYLLIYKNIVNFKIGKFAINMSNFVKIQYKSRIAIFQLFNRKETVEFLYNTEDKIRLGRTDLVEDKSSIS